MFVGSGGEQKQNGDDGGQENNNHHDEKRRWFLVCEADYMATNLNTGGPINLMREEHPADQYYLSCDDEEDDDDDDDDDRDYTHNSNNNYSPFFNVNVYNHTSSNDLFHLRQKSQRLAALHQQSYNLGNNSAAATTNYSTSSKSLAKEK